MIITVLMGTDIIGITIVATDLGIMDLIHICHIHFIDGLIKRRTTMYNYYPYDRNRYFVPFNPYNYQPISYYNYMKNQMAQNYQSIYNSGVMTDVIQSSNINQVGAGCTQPMPGEPPVPPV